MADYIPVPETGPLDFRLAFGSTPPKDLCPEHQRIWTAWQEYGRDHRGGTCDWSNPNGHVLDNRTHAEERIDRWCVAAREQLDLVEKLCRTGTSPQCTERPVLEPTAQPPAHIIVELPSPEGNPTP